MEIALTIRSAKGQTRVSVAATATLGDLKVAIAKALGVEVGAQILSIPPATLLVGRDEDTLKSLGIKGGALLLKEKEGMATSSSAPIASSEAIKTAATTAPPVASIVANPSAVTVLLDASHAGKLIRRIVAADNSCLFTSFCYVLEDKVRSKPQQLRSVVANVLERNQEIYTEAYLNKSNADYRKWIVLPGAWGGAIEVAILSEHYKAEVVVFDIQTNRFDLYGEGSHYARRVYLIYDGLHYDPMAWATSETAAESLDRVVFDPNDPLPLQSGHAYCKLMHDKKAFTDTSKFSLRCGVCGAGLAGEDEAMKHAQSTKPPHTNFQEFSK